MLRTISIQTSLYLMGGISILAVIGIAALGGFAFWKSAGNLRVEVDVSFALRHLMAVDMYHEGVEAAVLRGLFTGPNGTPQEKEAAMATLDSAVAGITQEYESLAASNLPPAHMEKIAAVKPALEAYVKTARSNVEIALQDVAMGKQQLPGFMAIFGKLEVSLDEVADAVETYGNEVEAAGFAENRLFAMLLAGGSAAVILLLLVTLRKFSRQIVKPIARLRAALDQVAGGDFALRIGAITRNDDIGAIARDIDRVSDRVVQMMDEQKALQDEAQQVIGRMGKELQQLAAGNLTGQISESFSGRYDQLRQDFNQAARQLCSSIREVVEVSDSIRAQSSDLSRASENLATRTENQAATLKETAAALEEVTSGMTSAAESAREVEDVVQRARQEVEHSGKIVMGAVTAMNEIEASSSQISQIIGVIDDIAFQTNLLALNAGVEAARAGEAGRGFAVVASEVRALAQRSSAAAKEIKGLISASVGQVERGVEQVDQARAALGSVVKEVAQISELVSNIAKGSREQARALHEINLGVTQLDQVTQQNAAMAEQSGAASRGVEDEALGLESIVGKFAVGGPQRAKVSASPGPAWIAA